MTMIHRTNAQARPAGTLTTETQARGLGRHGRRLLGYLAVGVLLLGAVAGLLTAGQQLLPMAATTENAVVGPVGECRGGQTAGVANGRIPQRLLCPAGHTDDGDQALLRADAAAALLELAAAWEADFGTPLCIRSAYRSWGEQARLYARMPAVAAPPGVSAHGWGTAADLCGGVADASSRQHAWMVQHGPEHGWVQPEWARAGGSRPEPWHWEYVHSPATFTG